MADKPTTLPEWASTEETDPVSGQLNRVEPPAERKESGWTRREIPPRQWWNWLLWRIWQWLKWVDAGTASATASTIMERDANGRSKVAQPSANADAANKGYVDTGDADTLNSAQSYTNNAVDDLSGVTDVPTARDNLGLGPEDLPIFLIRAWANFNGNGGVTIRGSGNIDSIVRDSDGEYTVTFSTPMPDSNYSVTMGECQTETGPVTAPDSSHPHTFTTSGFQIKCFQGSSTVGDLEIINIQVVR